MAGQIDANNGEKKLISTSDASLSMIYPNVAETTSAYLKNSSNDASIVCLLKNAGCSVLFTGDLEVAGWRSMLKRIPNLTCDVLKMPHHGACYEEADSFGLKDILDILKPEAAIISTGQHMKYRHPAERTINLLKEERIKVYCTQFTELCHDDLQQHKRKCFGDIEVRSDDTAYEIRGEADNMKCLNHVACN